MSQQYPDVGVGQTDITSAHQTGNAVASGSVNQAAFIIIAGAVVGLWLIGIFLRKG